MYQTFTEVKSALSSGKSVVNIVDHYLKTIQEQKEINAFLEVFETEAREQRCKWFKRFEKHAAHYVLYY